VILELAIPCDSSDIQNSPIGIPALERKEFHFRLFKINPHHFKAISSS
jgi:hypothetical protein